MSSNPVTRSHVQLTVKTTAAIINLVVILILDEVYGAVARWLTVLGESPHEPQHNPAAPSGPPAGFLQRGTWEPVWFLPGGTGPPRLLFPGSPVDPSAPGYTARKMI